MTAAPTLTVLLPICNNAATVQQTVASILAQTFADFELLLIDDASTDASPDLARALHDQRIIFVRNPERLELTRTLNKGLALARAPFIARIDADDLCLPERFEKLLAFLQTRPEIAVVGSFVQ